MYACIYESSNLHFFTYSLSVIIGMLNFIHITHSQANVQGIHLDLHDIAIINVLNFLACLSIVSIIASTLIFLESR
jgi:hypothetical protein